MYVASDLPKQNVLEPIVNGVQRSPTKVNMSRQKFPQVFFQIYLFLTSYIYKCLELDLYIPAWQCILFDCISLDSLLCQVSECQELLNEARKAVMEYQNYHYAIEIACEVLDSGDSIINSELLLAFLCIRAGAFLKVSKDVSYIVV
jgi:hypothetical protein